MPTHLYIVKKGSVELTHIEAVVGQQGQHQRVIDARIAVLGEKELLGADDILLERVHAFSAWCVSPVSLYVGSRTLFLKYMQEIAELRIKLTASVLAKAKLRDEKL
jgi:CRP-like cAMP-binding protein